MKIKINKHKAQKTQRGKMKKRLCHIQSKNIENGVQYED